MGRKAKGNRAAAIGSGPDTLLSWSMRDRPSRVACDDGPRVAIIALSRADCDRAIDDLSRQGEFAGLLDEMASLEALLASRRGSYVTGANVGIGAALGSPNRLTRGGFRLFWRVETTDDDSCRTRYR